jgi:hypothetical protein
MPNAKRAVVFLIGPDHGHARRASTDYRQHRAQRKDGPWKPARAIPCLDKAELARRAREFREAVNVQHRAALAHGRAVLGTA